MMLLLHLKMILRMLLLPPAGPLLVGFIGLLLLRRRPRTARVLLACTLGVLWLLAIPAVADAVTRLAEHFPPLPWSEVRGTQAIVILGGGGQRPFAPEYGGPAAEPELLERLAYGAYLARRTNLPVLVTGFGIEAAAMRASLQRNFDLDPRWVDDQSFDTFQNAQKSAQILERNGIHRLLLVTRATHMWRAVHEFTAAGLDVVPAPVGIPAPRAAEVQRYLPDAEALNRSTEAIYELIGDPVRALLAATHLRRH